MWRAGAQDRQSLKCVNYIHVEEKQGRLSLSTNGDKCATVIFFVCVGGSIKSLILSFNIQQYEFCVQI